MQISWIQICATLAGLLSHANPAVAVHLFPAGVESKSVGMASSLRAEGAPAVLYNPANLYLSKSKSAIDPYLELGMINVNYYYEHPQFDPVYVEVVSPTATVGYTHHFNDFVSAAGVVFPQETGETAIPGLPRRVGSDMQALSIKNENEVTDIGVGVSLKPLSKFSVGLSLVRTMEKRKLSATAINNENELVAIDYRNDFDRMVLGTRFFPSDLLHVSIAARPEQIKKYKGTQSDLGSESDPKVVNYEPQTIALGVGGWFGPFEWGVEANQQNWQAGSAHIKDGVNGLAPAADLKNVVHTAASIGYALSPSGSARLSIADQPSPWGDGNQSEDASQLRQGADYGVMNAIDRRIVATGASWQLGSFSFDMSAFYATGERKVSAEGANEGFYSLNIFSVSSGIKTNF